MSASRVRRPPRARSSFAPSPKKWGEAAPVASSIADSTTSGAVLAEAICSSPSDRPANSVVDVFRRYVGHSLHTRIFVSASNSLSGGYRCDFGMEGRHSLPGTTFVKRGASHNDEGAGRGPLHWSRISVKGGINPLRTAFPKGEAGIDAGGPGSGFSIRPRQLASFDHRRGASRAPKAPPSAALPDLPAT